MPLTAEGLLDQHGNNDGGDDDGIGDAGGHHQHDQRGKALAGRLMGLVARAVQRCQRAVAQVSGQQRRQKKQHRAQTVKIA